MENKKVKWIGVLVSLVIMLLFVTACMQGTVSKQGKTTAVPPQESSAVSAQASGSLKGGANESSVDQKMEEKMKNLQEIKSFEEITDEVIQKDSMGLYVKNFQSLSVKDGYGHSMDSFTGVMRYLSIQLKEPTSVELEYKIEEDEKNFNMVVLTAEEKVIPLDPKETKAVLSLPEGENYLVLTGYRGKGNFEVKFHSKEKLNIELQQDLFHWLKQQEKK